MSQIILTTERLYLRPLTHDDFADLFAIWSDAETMRYYPKTLDEPGMRAWIDQNLARYAEHGHSLWAVMRQADQQFLGDCGLIIQDVDGVAELEVGYQFNKHYWGHGYATEAARGCMDYAREQLHSRRIISMIRPENLPSRRVAERNGLQIEKELFWRGFTHYVYALNWADGRVCHRNSEGTEQD
jgi:[ribosomal protein S5]-alanine N-acetyltransferase